jgi:excisionase family DNA binding protein
MPREAEPWVTLQEVAQHLQISDDTAHRWISLRGMPTHKAGRVACFKLSEGDQWIARGAAAYQYCSKWNGME